MDRERVLPQLLVKVEEAARLCRISRSRMYELMATGEVPSCSIGRSRRIPLDRLQAWIDAQIEPIGETDAPLAVGPEKFHSSQRARHERGIGQ